VIFSIVLIIINIIIEEGVERSDEMPSTGANKRVTISSVTDLVIPMAASGECETGEQPPISPPHGSQQLFHHRHHHQSVSSSSSCSQSSDDYIIRKRELLRLESLVRCQVQSQWQLSIENYRCQK